MEYGDHEFSDSRDGEANKCDKARESFQMPPILRFLDTFVTTKLTPT